MSKTVSGKHYPKELIAQVITDYAEHIRSAKQLAAYYGIPYNTVKYWIKKYNKNGMDALLKPRSGGKYITYDAASSCGLLNTGWNIRKFRLTRFQRFFMPAVAL